MALSTEQWDVVKAHYERGKSPSEIARIVPFNISRQGISKRIASEGWERNQSVAGPAMQPLEIPPEVDPIKAALVAQIAAHGTASIACRSLGVPDRTYRDWKQKDAQFAALVDAATAQLNVPVVSRAYQAAKEDPKYSWRWMESQIPEFAPQQAKTHIGSIKIGHLIQRDPNHKVPHLIEQED